MSINYDEAICYEIREGDLDSFLIWLNNEQLARVVAVDTFRHNDDEHRSHRVIMEGFDGVDEEKFLTRVDEWQTYCNSCFY